MNSSAKPKLKQPAFVRRAERALVRAARNVKEENRRLGLPLLVWGNGKSDCIPLNSKH